MTHFRIMLRRTPRRLSALALALALASTGAPPARAQGLAPVQAPAPALDRGLSREETDARIAAARAKGDAARARLREAAAQSAEPIEETRRRADFGDVAAQVTLGELHARGQRGLARDPEASARWFAKAAAAGDAHAQRVLGSLAYFGVGMPKDETAAARWFKASADQGNQEARFSLGRMTLEGKGGVGPDAAGGLAMVRAAIESGALSGPSAAAGAEELARAHREGGALRPDRVEASFWQGVAASFRRGDKDAKTSFEGTLAGLSPMEADLVKRRIEELHPTPKPAAGR